MGTDQCVGIPLLKLKLWVCVHARARTRARARPRARVCVCVGGLAWHGNSKRWDRLIASWHRAVCSDGCRIEMVEHVLTGVPVERAREGERERLKINVGTWRFELGMDEREVREPLTQCSVLERHHN